jgi:hypothetical protein
MSRAVPGAPVHPGQYLQRLSNVREHHDDEAGGTDELQHSGRRPSACHFAKGPGKEDRTRQERDHALEKGGSHVRRLNDSAHQLRAKSVTMRGALGKPRKPPPADFLEIRRVVRVLSEKVLLNDTSEHE